MGVEHLPLLTELDADPAVLRYILGRARTASEVAAFWGPICADREADRVGLGWWVGFDQSLVAGGAGDAASFLGWWDLSPAVPVADRPTWAEAGWRLRRSVWRRGLASEGASAVFRHGFEQVGLDVVWAETMAVNVASRGVMERLGMRHTSTVAREWDHPLPGAEAGEVIYEITREQWRSRSAGRAR